MSPICPHLFTITLLLTICHSQAEVEPTEKDVEKIAAYPIHTIVLHCGNNTNSTATQLPLNYEEVYTWHAPWYNKNTTTGISIFTTDGKNVSSWKFTAPPQLFVSSVDLFANGTLTISPMRGAFLGEWQCYHQQVLKHRVALEPHTFVMEQYVTSLIVGLTSLGGALVMGIIVGAMRYVYENKCSKSKSKTRKAFLGVIPVPLEEDESVDVDGVDHHHTISIPEETAQALLREANDATTSMNQSGSQSHRHSSSTLNADVDLVFMDQQVAEEYKQVLDSLAQSQNDPTRFSERMEELRSRLRCDVGRRVKIMRSRMRTLREESASRMSRAVQSLGSTSALAAQKMRHGFTTSVYAMKDQMRSVAELCGSVHVGQTISIVSITKEDGEEKVTVLKNYTFK